MGHVPAGPVRLVGTGGDVQRRQHRGAPGEGDVLIVAADRRRRLGAAGEDAAAAWYRDNGYEIVARNWRSAQGEIDLVARQQSTLVFCEVKTRSSTAFGEPYEAVTRTKQVRLRGLAAEWLRVARPAGRFELRFDVASVRGTSVEVIEGAF